MVAKITSKPAVGINGEDKPEFIKGLSPETIDRLLNTDKLAKIDQQLKSISPEFKELSDQRKSIVESAKSLPAKRRQLQKTRKELRVEQQILRDGLKQLGSTSLYHHNSCAQNKPNLANWDCLLGYTDDTNWLLGTG